MTTGKARPKPKAKMIPPAPPPDPPPIHWIVWVLIAALFVIMTLTALYYGVNFTTCRALLF